MFFGEFLCLLAFRTLVFIDKQSQNKNKVISQLIEGKKKYNVFILFPPAIADVISIGMQLVGLTLTYASSFQMLHGGFLVVSTALFSWIFLKKQLVNFQYI